MPLKDECGICGRVLPYAYLRRCQRCGKLFCRDCMVPDVSTSDPTRMLCLHCARKIVSPKSDTKYRALNSYLKFRAAFTNTVRLSLAEIDGIIKDNLPMSAYKNEKWWNNNPTNAHAKAWIDAGWKVQETNLKEGYVVFQKVKEIMTKDFKKKARGKENQKPFTPIPTKVLKSTKPSKTKVSKLYARLKNIERQRTAMPLYPGSFKPKPPHEKRLFKPEKKS
ncbi:MAG: DUF7662 domain-containing protein [Candidatus Bathycorpusculaceae bacterium]